MKGIFRRRKNILHVSLTFGKFFQEIMFSTYLHRSEQRTEGNVGCAT
jgi:hypothetical protein